MSWLKLVGEEETRLPIPRQTNSASGIGGFFGGYAVLIRQLGLSIFWHKFTRIYEYFLPTRDLAMVGIKAS